MIIKLKLKFPKKKFDKIITIYFQAFCSSTIGLQPIFYGGALKSRKMCKLGFFFFFGGGGGGVQT